MTRLQLCITTLAIFAASICQAQDAEKRPGARHHPDPEQFITRLDVNEDGVLSENEFIESRLDRAERQFERRDRDDDGFIDSDEAHRPRHNNDEIDREVLLQCLRDELGDDYTEPSTHEERFDAADSNGDGVLSLEEFSAALETRAYASFERIDTDENGFINLAELESTIEAKKDHHEILRSCKEQASDPFEE